MTSPILLVGISNCRQWVILIVVEHRQAIRTSKDCHCVGRNPSVLACPTSVSSGRDLMICWIR
jgi:hypothetical protein